MILSEELSSYCKSGLLSEEGLRAIIERHGLKLNAQYNGDDVGEYAFFVDACYNKRVTEGIIRCLLEYFPDAISATDNRFGWTPLHIACWNENVTLSIIQCLLDADPDSVRNVTNIYGSMPLHTLCRERDLDEIALMQILKLLIEKCPEAVRHVDKNGKLPIHIAAGGRSPEFCRVLIEAYPGSERIPGANGALPLDSACTDSNFGTVQYLYNLFPAAIHYQTTVHGYYPIHSAMLDVFLPFGGNAVAAVKIVKFLLDCDPNVKLQRCEGKSLLEFACDSGLHNDRNIHDALANIEVIYDAHPEAIYALDIETCHQHVQAFLNWELVYARQAKDHRLMTTPDNNGRLPLHKALQNNVRLGSIKLLVKGNPAALQSADENGSLPLHLACQHHDSTDVVVYLVGLDPSTLDAVDQDGNTALHLLCRSARHDIIALFLDEFDAVSVSTRNADEKLPIDLLSESNAVEDRHSMEYVESLYRLLRANPEMIMDIDLQTIQSSASTLPCPNGKKRKFGQ